MKSIYLGIFYSLLAVVIFFACSGTGTEDPGDSSASITISEPDNNSAVSGTITVRGDSSSLDSLTVTVDNDPASNRIIALSGYGNWETEIDTTRFIDGEHAIIAYDADNINVRAQIIISTDNGNGGGYTVTVPVTLSDGIYDEISIYKPLYVYLKSRANGQVYGKIFTSGSLIFDDENKYDIENIPNGLYEVSAFLDRNHNMDCDEGTDFHGTASIDLNVANMDCTSAEVVLSIYDGTDSESGTNDEELLDPAASGSISITNPSENAVLSGNIDINGQVTTGIEYVAVEIDNNFFSRKVVEVSIVMPRPYDWGVEFDTTSLQDGLHFIKAYVNDNIYAVKSFISENGNNSGYIVTVPVEPAESFSGEINESNPLYVYVKMPATGTMIIRKYISGEIPGSFSINNVPNGDYFTGAFLDKNNNQLIDRGDCTGVAGNMLRVWYASEESPAVTLHGTEVQVTQPDDENSIPEIQAGTGYSIHAEGTYRFMPDEITLSMRKGAMTYAEVETDATVFSFDPATHLGTWEADLDISEVFGRGHMWLNVKSRYGAHYEYDSVLVNLVTDDEREIYIALPADGSHIFTNTLSASGIYTDIPGSINIYLEYTDSGVPQSISIPVENIIYANGEWSAIYNGLSGLNIDDDELIIRAEALYSDPAYTSQDSVSVTIDYRIETGIEIASPEEGENVGAESATVSGSYEGEPGEISVVIGTGSGTKPASGVSFNSGAWTAVIDLEGVDEGSRVITATADYGYWGSVIDEVTVNVDSGIAIPNFTYRYEVLSDDFVVVDEILFYIGMDDLMQHEYDVSVSDNPETSWYISGTDDASAYWDYYPTYYCQVGVAVRLSDNIYITGNSTINLYFNDRLEYTSTLDDSHYHELQGYIQWQAGSDTLIFHDGAWW